MSKSIIFSTHAPAPIGPYSQAVAANGLLFVSGQLAIEQASGKFLNQDIEAETHQVLKNLKLVLEQAGTGLHNVLKCTIYVRDLNNFQLINTVYASYFEENPPARETVEVSRLPKDANVEISCIALLG